MLNSMTAYATRTGTHGPFSWVWELRGVNGKGLDLRPRVPDWVDGLEPALRSAVTKACARGNIQASLKITRSEADAATRIDEEAVGAVLSSLKAIESLAAQSSVVLAPTRAIDILTMRAVTDAKGQDDGGPELAAAIIADIAPLVDDFSAMRANEGAALATVITGQLDGITALVAAAKALLPDRAKAQEQSFRTGLARVMAEVEIDETKLAQELAQLAIKSDVMEEIDRLEAHIVAASEMLNSQAPTGRKLDFLMQEFNREANTLCSKSGDADLTRIGLDLKVAIDQMREQIQNVE
ncbi:MAG: YicC/YloC family endoribonuclease [Pseudomonadota bacterium]